MKKTSWDWDAFHRTCTKEKCGYYHLKYPVLINPQTETSNPTETKNKHEDIDMPFLSDNPPPPHTLTHATNLNPIQMILHWYTI